MYACHVEFNNSNVFIGLEQTRRISQRHNVEKALRFNYDFSVLFLVSAVEGVTEGLQWGFFMMNTVYC